MKKAWKLAEPVHALDATDGAGFVLRELVAVSRLEFRRRITNEEDLPLLFIVRIGVKKQDRLFLFETGQIK